ncbi:penicillin-binding protein 1C [Roseibium denhamense]|uniref:peptidoglycan glycosyltransferase n=1 Tax=Roseibium denhamense TaxID=76305 RepID=A0ABY1NX59_9HYPH|nr:penicillin-binding protein 1C [Roseibium denhamense]SMP19572.1 penicillin-binding protein 1C [Roseibium denhamense]
MGALLGLILCGVAGLAVFKVASDIADLPQPPRPEELPVSPVVLDRNGLLLRAFTSGDDKWRLPVTLDDIDPLYFRMLLAFEDRRFYQHSGADWRAFLRSAVQSVRQGRLVSGGSTITMQVARLLDEKPTRSLARKYEQIIKAIHLEQVFSKDEILTLYALRAPFGSNLEGVRAASLTWFGKEPGRLTPAEAALLVALPQSPEARRPDRSPERARIARDRVLRRAQDAGVLSEDEALSAMAEPLRAERHPMPLLAAHSTRHAVHANQAAQVLELTLDRKFQSAVEELARQRVKTFPPPISMAVLVADHQTGEILVSLGAPDLLDESRDGHVDMSRAVRSPGSTLKPLIYGLAFEERIGLPDSLIKDRPINVAGYQPTNFDMAYQGTVSLREALQLSLNTPAVQLLEAVGPARMLARMKRAGAHPVLDKQTPAGLAVALGGMGLSLRDLVQLYAAVARGGEAVRLKECRITCPEIPSTPNGLPVLSQEASWMLADILSDMPQLHAAETRQIAYKTGTSYGYRDAWAVGYDGRYVTGVWIGRPDGSPIAKITGASAAVPVLFDVFQKLGAEPVPLPTHEKPLWSRQNGSVPKALIYARLPNTDESPSSANGFGIAFPPNGAELDLGLQTEGKEQPLIIKLQGGTGPFTIFKNGVPQNVRSIRRNLTVDVQGPGFVDLMILDSSGQSAQVSILVH